MVVETPNLLLKTFAYWPTRTGLIVRVKPAEFGRVCIRIGHHRWGATFTTDLAGLQKKLLCLLK